MSPISPRRRRKLAAPTGAILAFLLILSLVGGSVYLWPQRFMWPNFFGTAVFCVQTPKPWVALTFDDGPDPRYTSTIAALLKQYQAKATFFIVGRHGQKYPALLKKLMAAGHELGNHTFNHPNLNFTLPPTIQTEIGRTDAILKQVQYPDPVYIRPPYGRAGITVTSTLKPLGRSLILWDIDLMDWTAPPVSTMMATLGQQLKPGSIVLLHDGSAGLDPTNPKATDNRKNTIAVVKKILATYTARGYRFVTVSELLGAGEALPSLNQCQKRPSA